LTGINPLNVQFTDLSIGDISSWQWDFNNNGSIDSEEQNPEWTYDEPGIYSVSLTVSDGVNSDIEIKLDYINVEGDINQGLIAYYPFSGNTDDYSGNGHHGINYGATLTTDRFGIPDNAYDFDGSSNYMDMGNWFNYNDFTISMWVNRETIGNSWRVLIDNNHPNNWVIQSHENSNDFVFGLYPDGGVDFTIDLNQWDYVVCIKDGTSIKTYIDGVFQNESTMIATINYNNPNLNISRWGAGGRFFDGKIDDIRMYDRALSENEIQMLYNEQPPALNADFTASSIDIILGETIQFTDLSSGNPTSWQWDFDNNGTIDSEEQNPEWIYDEPGIYTVSLTVSDGTNQDTETKEDYITVLESVQADFSADPVEGIAPLIVQFSDLSEGEPTNWQWDFNNDGIIDSEEQNPEWTYNEHGIYTVSLTVSDGTNEDTETKEDYIIVLEPVQADFSADPVQGIAPLIVQFSDLSSGNPTTWQWDFQNDGTIDSEEENPEWIYDEPGIYTVSLTVSDGTNQDTEIKTDYITVNSNGQEQLIELPAGYSFVSTRMIPENSDFKEVCNNILANLDFARNSNGSMLRKIGPMWINGIGDWITTEGYLFRMNNADELIITGDVIDPQTPVSLVEGYQFISYLPENPLNALDVFTDILSNLDFLRNSTGGMLRKIGPMWVNGIGDMNPGEGYLAKMINPDELIYPGPASSCGEPFTDSRDGQTYNTVLIGEQCWMAENLNVGEMIIGTQEMTNNSIIEKYCYENNTANCNAYGGLYQWEEMMQYSTTPGVQGICPEGWYIPTDDEWKILEGTVDSQYPVGDPIWNGSGYRGFDAGLNLKSTSGWYPNANGTDLFGFTALPAGYRYHLGTFNNIEASAEFWSSTENNTTAWARLLYYNSNKTFRGNPMKSSGHSIRCLKQNSNFEYSSAKTENKDFNLSNSTANKNEVVHFVFEGGNAAEIVYTIYIDGLQVGDEVAAFDDGIMIGSLVINSNNVFENDLAIFNIINSGQGYIAGNPIQLKIWNSNSQKTSIAEYKMSDPYNEAYMQNVYPSVDGLYSVIKITNLSTGIENIENEISIYPNPAIEKVNIVSNEIIKNIQIINFLGKVVLNVEVNNEQTFVNTAEFQSGVYIFRINTDNSTFVKKVTVK
ncbi:MAG: PKD domain-containing protein, partial [Bacteroidales bacterium]|nr:PKD domain-containing protein [Bacteroidales bacterium]